MRWQSGFQLRHQVRPIALRAWLEDEGSLTSALIALSKGDFQVRLLKQQWGRAQRDEALALGIPFHHRCMIREVLLCGRGRPWVYARSVLPASSLQGPLAFLKKLGNKPLGALLFSDPGMQRGPIEIALVPTARIALAQGHPVQHSSAWGRRSVFRLANKPLLVSEVFLPGFFPAICH